MNYFELLQKIRNQNKNKEFLIINEERYTYNQIYIESKLLGEKINFIAGKNDTVDKKHRILIYSDNIYFQVMAFFAGNFANFIPIVSHYNLPEKVLSGIIIKNNISYVLADGRIGFKGIENNEETLEGFRNLFLYTINENQQEDINSKVCMGVLTSGTTGTPKVLHRTYESWVDFFRIQNEIFGVNEKTKLFINGSISFTGNLNVIMSVLYEGGTIIDITDFHCRKWINTIIKEKVTNIYLVPTKLKILINFLTKDISFVKSIFTGSQLLFEDVAYNLKEKFPNSQLILYYGATELNYITYFRYEETCNKPLSVGKPFPDVNIFIKDGFIYADNKYQVEEKKSPSTVYDMGYIDEDGDLIFYGRKDNVINKGGMKISGARVENEIRKINEVSDVAVAGYEHNDKGNEIAAFIVSTEEVKKSHIIQKLKSCLMDVEIPKKIIFVDNIPLNDSGKIDRFRLVRENIPLL